MGTEEEDVDVLPGVDLRTDLVQEEIGLEGKPAQGEAGDDDYQLKEWA